MKNTKSFQFLCLSLFAAITISSCAIHSGMITSPNVLEKSNQKYVDIAVGYSSASYVLGLGGLSKFALIDDAKRNLMASYPLKSNQSFQNFSVNIKRSFYLPFYSKQEVIVTADVVENENNVGISFSDDYKKMIGVKPNDNGFFKANETVIYTANNGGYFYAKILQNFGFYLNKEDFEYRIFYLNSNKNIVIKNCLENEMFKTIIEDSLQKKLGLAIGQNIKFQDIKVDFGGNEIKKIISQGVVMGINARFVLVKTEQNLFLLKSFSEIQK